MKYIVAFAAIALGYAACSPTVRELFMSQPVWAFVVEGIVAYVVCGFPAFVHSASKYVRLGTQERPDSGDMGDGVLAWITWPIYAVYLSAMFVWNTIVSPTNLTVGSKLASVASSYGKKRRKNVDKNS